MKARRRRECRSDFRPLAASALLAVFIKHSKLTDGREILARSLLVPDEARSTAYEKSSSGAIDGHGGGA